MHNTLPSIVSLCKRKGFIYPASEIYDGINGFWDYGPLGILLKNNIRDIWWQDMVLCPPLGLDGEPVIIYGLDSSIIQNPKTWEASGHLSNFSDLLVDCKETKYRYRADHLTCVKIVLNIPDARENELYVAVIGRPDKDYIIKRIQAIFPNIKSQDMTLLLDESVIYTDLNKNFYKKVIAPQALNIGTLTPPRPFNLLFETQVSAMSSDNKAFLRPETAQGIFLNFKNIQESMRAKIPFGIAQIGKSFRNEINPRNFIFRSREFEQMEMEWFCKPEDSNEWYKFWQEQRLNWWIKIGLDNNHIKLRNHENDELSHYSNFCTDIEYLYPFTAPDFGELEGIAHRGNYDLTQHQKYSNSNLSYTDQEQGSFIPHVIEPASGLTRAVLAVLCSAYTKDENRPSKEYLKLKPCLAPIKIGIFPLVDKDGLSEKAFQIYSNLRKTYTCNFEKKNSIGKRYARMDEIGTPYCITIDYETLKNNNVTIRERDSTHQEKVNIEQINNFMRSKFDS